MGVEQGGGYFTFCSVNKKYFVLNEPTTFRSIYIQVLKGATDTYSNLVIRPMLEYGSVQSTFEPYSGENVMSDVNGLCTVTSKSPTMTLFTDTPGIIIEAEYNVDTKTWIKNYIRDNATGGGEGSSAPRLTTISLLASTWVTTSPSLHSQVVTITGITNNSRVDLFPTVAQLAIFHEKDVAFVTENDNGTVTVYAIGDKPLNDYTMQAQITEVLR